MLIILLALCTISYSRVCMFTIIYALEDRMSLDPDLTCYMLQKLCYRSIASVLNMLHIKQYRSNIMLLPLAYKTLPQRQDGTGKVPYHT